MKRIKVGLAGFGRFSELVLINILTRSPWDLLAIADTSKARRNLARQLTKDVEILESYQELILQPNIEAVIISLPSNLHAEASILAFQHGKHVYLEKPIATNIVDAKCVIESWKGSKCAGMIGLNYRFHPLNQLAQKYFSQNKLEDVFHVTSSFSSPIRELPKWQHSRESGGGVLLHLATHHIDLIRFILGAEVRTVFSKISTQIYPGDTAWLQMTLDNNITTQSFFSHSAVREDVFHFYQKTGKLTIDRYHSLNLELTKPDIQPSRFPAIARYFKQLINSPVLRSKLSNPRREPSYKLAFDRFADAIKSRISPSPDLWDGYYSFLVVEAAEKSAQIGKVVNLEQWASESTACQ